MMVSGIVLAAVATLAYATGKADTALDDVLTGQRFLQADMRRIRDALRHSRRVFVTPNCIALWRADDNGDNKINGSELQFLRTVGSDLRLHEFRFHYPSGQTIKHLTIPTLGDAAAEDAIVLEVSVAEIESDTAFHELDNLARFNLNTDACTLMRLPDRYNPDICTDPGVKVAYSNIDFSLLSGAMPQYVNLGYDLTVKRVRQGGQVTGQTTVRYNVPAVLLCSADNLILSGEIVSDDD